MVWHSIRAINTGIKHFQSKDMVHKVNMRMQYQQKQKTKLRWVMTVNATTNCDNETISETEDLICCIKRINSSDNIHLNYTNCTTIANMSACHYSYNYKTAFRLKETTGTTIAQNDGNMYFVDRDTTVQCHRTIKRVNNGCYGF